MAKVAGRELKLSNLDKVLYPAGGFTKRELIDYYAEVAPAMLGHLGDAADRHGSPDGVTESPSSQKQSLAHRPEWVRTVTRCHG